MQEAAHDNGFPDLVPASMLAAYAFCPRLCYLQFVHGEFADSAELADGRFQHRWIDAAQDAVPEGFQPFRARSVSLSAPQAGLCCTSISWRGTAIASCLWSISGARPGRRGPMSRI